MKLPRISLPNALIIGTCLMVGFVPSMYTLGAMFIVTLHASSVRFSRFHKTAQANAQIKQSEASEARLARLETKIDAVSSAMSMTKLGSR